MDYRRCFGLRAPRPIGDSTILVPQLENFSLFATPFLDINNKIVKLIEGSQQDVKTQPEDESTGKRTTRQMLKKKDEADAQKLSKEASKAGDSFGIVLNVVTVKPEQIAITFGEGNMIEVKVVQKNVKSEYGSITLSRNCTYKYELPDGVDKKSLFALWTSDDYLIILPDEQLRRDLLTKSIVVVEDPAESLEKCEATGGKGPVEKSDSKPSTSKCEETETKKLSKSEDGKQKATEKEPDTEDVFDAIWEITVHSVTRMLRPELDIFMLRKYLIDLESYVSTARKFIENASFVSHNSKSAERSIRFLANLHADEFFEKVYLKGVSKMKRKIREPSPDSGYSTSEGNVTLRSLLQN